MAELYLGRFEDALTDHEGDPVPSGSYWRPPGGDNSGCLQLRTRDQAAAIPNSKDPQGWGLFVYDGLRNYPELELHLGNLFDGQIPGRDLSALNTLLGKSVQETRLDRVVREIMFAHGDPRGVDSWKPLRISRTTGAHLKLGPWDIREKYSESHPGFQTSVDTYRESYRKHKTEGLTLEQLQRFTASTMIRLYGRTGDDLLGILPAEHSGDGWKRPATTIGDDFTEGSDTALASHTPTGTGGFSTWTEVTGTWTVIAASDDLDSSGSIGPAVTRSARASTGFSDDIHDSQVDVTSGAASNKFGDGVAIRYSGSAEDFISGDHMFNFSAPRDYIGTVSAGVWTQIASGNNGARSTSFTANLDGNASDLITFDRDGSSISVTETGLNGNLNVGLHGRSTASAQNPTVTMDNFVSVGTGGGGGATTRRYSLMTSGVG